MVCGVEFIVYGCFHELGSLLWCPYNQSLSIWGLYRALDVWKLLYPKESMGVSINIKDISKRTYGSTQGSYCGS